MGLATRLIVGSCRNSNHNNHTTREQELSAKWFYRPIKMDSPEQFLEDEIYFLRRRMEQMFNQEQSLTSDSVIELSSLLDLKINEYMYKSSMNR
jgi:hypothetical protein